MSDYSKIFIRLGHDTLANGNFTGATGYLTERSVIDAYGNAIKKQLAALGYTVKTYRSTAGTYSTSFEALKAGVAAAEDWGADVFISCHANSYSSSSTNGTEVYYNNVYFSEWLAEDVRGTVCDCLGTKSRGAKDGIDAGYYEMKNTTIPAIIIEPLFVTNQSDCNKFTNYGGSKLGKAIANTIDAAIMSYT